MTGSAASTFILGRGGFLECVSKLPLWVAPGDEGAAEREKGFVDVRAAFVAQREAAEAMQPGQGAFDNPVEDAAAHRPLFW